MASEKDVDLKEIKRLGTKYAIQKISDLPKTMIFTLILFGIGAVFTYKVISNIEDIWFKYPMIFFVFVAMFLIGFWMIKYVFHFESIEKINENDNN